jgi:PAS domain S-box-containing protein
LEAAIPKLPEKSGQAVREGTVPGRPAAGASMRRAKPHGRNKEKPADPAWRESQEIIAAILDAVPARIFWKDKNLVYLGCNVQFARDSGFSSPEDVIGKDDYQMGWREQAELYRRDDREVIETGRSKLLIDEPQTTPEGKTITLLTSKVPLRDSNGEIFGVLGTYLDVTERARLEEELATRNAQFDAALNNMAQGLLMYDRDGRLVISNRRFAELFNLPREKWKTASLGVTIQETMQLIREWTNVTEKNQPQIMAEVEALLARGKGGQIVFERTDGKTFNSLTAPTADGGFVVTFEDITEQRRIEEKISYLAHHDALTGLPNRPVFYEKLGELLARPPQGGSFAVLSLDLDQFKSVNDMLGHPVGDKLLQAAAKRMFRCARDTDIIARLGGDDSRSSRRASSSRPTPPCSPPVLSMR